MKYLASRDKELARVFITENRAAFIFQKASSCPNRSRDVTGYLVLAWPLFQPCLQEMTLDRCWEVC